MGAWGEHGEHTRTWGHEEHSLSTAPAALGIKPWSTGTWYGEQGVTFSWAALRTFSFRL